MGPSAKSLPFTSQSGHSSLFIYCQGAGRREHWDEEIYVLVLPSSALSI